MSFWQSRTKIDAADSLFSKFIRFMRDGNRCQRCGADGRVSQLENSHFHGRRMESVRFDPENADALCRPCHAFFEARKSTDYHAWKLERLGSQRFGALEIRAATHQKKDRKMSMMIVRAMIREWESKSGPAVFGRKA